MFIMFRGLSTGVMMLSAVPTGSPCFSVVTSTTAVLIDDIMVGVPENSCEKCHKKFRNKCQTNTHKLNKKKRMLEGV